MEDKDVATVDGVFKGTFGALGDNTWFGNGSFSGCHGGLWWLIMDEEDDGVIEVVEVLLEEETLVSSTSHWLIGIWK
nr:hypothetical protein [Tanacetum cinerariifolium]